MFLDASIPAGLFFLEMILEKYFQEIEEAEEEVPKLPETPELPDKVIILKGEIEHFKRSIAFAQKFEEILSAKIASMKDEE